MEREWGENPLRLNCRCVHRMFLYPLSKDSHWETEKAGYKNAGFTYMVRVTRPALMLSRKCVGSIGVAFSD